MDSSTVILGLRAGFDLLSAAVSPRGHFPRRECGHPLTHYAFSAHTGSRFRSTATRIVSYGGI